MTIFDELRHLYRMFPRATELAVSPEMVESYETACIALHRFSHDSVVIRRWAPVERFRAITAQRLSLVYRDKHLTLVKRIAA